MKIATCLTSAGTIGNPFDAESVCVYEKQNDSWVREKQFSYFLDHDMGIGQARMLLRGIASQITDCEVFLLPELQGYAHVWLEELGFRTWKSDGPLSVQLENVAVQDAFAFELKQRQPAPCCGAALATDGCGSGGGCGGGNYSTMTEKDLESLHPIPSPIPVGDSADRRFRIDLAAILDLDPILNSRQVLIPFLEKKQFRVFEIHFSHIPKWFARTIDHLDLEAAVTDSVPPAHGVDVRITAKTKQ